MRILHRKNIGNICRPNSDGSSGKKRNFVLIPVAIAVLTMATDCERPGGYVGAMTAGDSTAPTVSVSTLGGVTTADGTSLGDWSADPDSTHPRAEANFQSDVQVILMASATDNDGGLKAVRVFAYNFETYCVTGGVGTLQQGLQLAAPKAEAVYREPVSDGTAVPTTQWSTYLLHDRKPARGDSDDYCVETWVVHAEGENFSGTTVKTQPLTFTFDTRRTVG